MNGWTCPSCGSVWAPWVAECRKCNGYQTPTWPIPWNPGYPWKYDPGPWVGDTASNAGEGQ